MPAREEKNGEESHPREQIFEIWPHKRFIKKRGDLSLPLRGTVISTQVHHADGAHTGHDRNTTMRSRRTFCDTALVVMVGNSYLH